MSLHWVRAFCLSLPYATEDVKWEKDLAFCIGAKMFAVISLEPGAAVLGFKCSPTAFAELVERPGVIPAPYLARAHWVALEHAEALPRRELEPLLGAAYQHVRAKLPKRVQTEFLQTKP
jgi:predicted DNA-binding protein (MmcQ/YjbR family)